MKVGWHVVKGMKLALPELGTGRRRFPLQCCTPQTKNDCHPQMPVETGKALEAYVLKERPKTNQRMVFVRHVAPYDQPIGVDGSYTRSQRRSRLRTLPRRSF